MISVKIRVDSGVGVLLHEFYVGGHHFFYEIDESGFRAPSEHTLRLGRVAQQKLHFGRTIELGIYLWMNFRNDVTPLPVRCIGRSVGWLVGLRPAMSDL